MDYEEFQHRNQPVPFPKKESEVDTLKVDRAARHLLDWLTKSERPLTGAQQAAFDMAARGETKLIPPGALPESITTTEAVNRVVEMFTAPGDRVTQEYMTVCLWSVVWHEYTPPTEAELDEQERTQAMPEQDKDEWYMACLLCEQNSGAKFTTNLIDNQSHLMEVHGVTLSEIRSVNHTEDDKGRLTYTTPAGKNLMLAIKGFEGVKAYRHEKVLEALRSDTLDPFTNATGVFSHFSFRDDGRDEDEEF